MSSLLLLGQDEGQEDLPRLALVTGGYPFLVGKGDVADKLLGNRTGADRPAPLVLVAQVAENGCGDGRGIKTRILPEGIVLHGDGCLDDVLRQLLVGQPAPLLRRLHLEEETAVTDRKRGVPPAPVPW